jgi:hypothetical protein
MVKREVEPSQVWNVSGGIASAAYEVIYGDMEYDELVEKHPHTPFENEQEIQAAFVAADMWGDVDGDTLTTQEVAANDVWTGADKSNSSDVSVRNLRYLIKDIMQSDDYTPVGVFDDNSDGSSEESDGVDGSDDTLDQSDEQDSSDGSSEETDEVDGSDDALDEPDEQDTNDGSSEESDEVDGSDRSGDPSLPKQIAEHLARLFIDRDSNSYSDVTNEFPQVDFPLRQVAMMEVVNSSGSTRDERVDDIVAWVETWFDDPSAVEEMNDNRPYPMGAV